MLHWELVTQEYASIIGPKTFRMKVDGGYLYVIATGHKDDNNALKPKDIFSQPIFVADVKEEPEDML